MLGALCLLWWTLTIVTMSKYLFIVLNANDHGEGARMTLGVAASCGLRLAALCRPCLSRAPCAQQLKGSATMQVARSPCTRSSAASRGSTRSALPTPATTPSRSTPRASATQIPRARSSSQAMHRPMFAGVPCISAEGCSGIRHG